MPKSNLRNLVETEFNATAYRYHLVGAWVGIVVNPVWAIIDYYNIPAHFTDFWVFRITITLATLITVLLRRKLVDRPAIIILVPFFGIAIQNAYMYSVMDIPEIQKHTFAFIALFIGGSMFILWKPIYSLVVVGITLIVSVFLFWLNSDLLLSDILINGGLLTATVALFSILLIYTRTNLTKKEIIARLALVELNKQLEVKTKIIEEKNKDISDSINYAQRIQHAILPSKEDLDNVLNDYFILYKPKDIVSGDFYWLSSITKNEAPEQIVVIAAADCTGHGVPGALMSSIGSSILNQTRINTASYKPAKALEFLNREISKSLNSIRDGMDISLCAINIDKMELQFAGANNPLYIIRNKELMEVKADKKAIGADIEDAEIKTFTNHVIPLQKGDVIYLFTDGYADQFGGPKGKKFKYKQFQEVLVQNHECSMEEQKERLYNHFANWKGDLEQVDDILVIGIRI